MVTVQEDYPRFQQAGGDVALITMGNALQTAAFRQRLKLELRCLADPERRAYRAFGVAQGSVGQVGGPAVWLPGIKALARGGLGLPVGDPLQMHGAFIIDTEGKIRFVHDPKHSADLPAHDRMLETLQVVASGGHG